MVTLLAQKAIDVSTKKQSDSASKVKFSSTNYWSSETIDKYNLNRGANGGKYDSNITETSAIGYAEAYAKAIGAESGRLLTKEEADKLSTDILKLSRENWWLSSCDDRGIYVYIVNHETGIANTLGPYSNSYLVRPVITISKSLIQ